MIKIKIEIKNRFTGKLIFEYEKENNTVSETVKEYIRQEIEEKGKYRANLTDADLTRANLTDADLTRANLTYADLTDADLTRANLTYADLLQFKSDLWRILLMAKHEIPGLLIALREGRINGTAYEGSCACLKGTIANVAGKNIKSIPWMVKNTSEPAESWFLQIKEGDNPENSGVVRKTIEWIEEFLLYLNN